jgi:hypothetical protein
MMAAQNNSNAAWGGGGWGWSSGCGNNNININYNNNQVSHYNRTHVDRQETVLAVEATSGGTILNTGEALRMRTGKQRNSTKVQRGETRLPRRLRRART